jgi:hypothetical protein
MACSHPCASGSVNSPHSQLATMQFAIDDTQNPYDIRTSTTVFSTFVCGIFFSIQNFYIYWGVFSWPLHLI